MTSQSNMNLQDLDGEFEKAKMPDLGFEDLPEGKYDIITTEASLGYTRTNKRCLRLPFTVQSPPEQRGARNTLILLLEPEVLEYLKQNLAKLGMRDVKPSDLPSRLADFEGMLVEIAAKKRGDYTNYYINKRIGRSASTADGDDVPF